MVDEIRIILYYTIVLKRTGKSTLKKELTENGGDTEWRKKKDSFKNYWTE